MKWQCRECGRTFTYTPAKNEVMPDWWPTCGHKLCRAIATYNQIEWDGAARMADSRIAHRLPTNDLDAAALRRRSVTRSE